MFGLFPFHKRVSDNNRHPKNTTERTVQGDPVGYTVGVTTACRWVRPRAGVLLAPSLVKRPIYSSGWLHFAR